MERCRDPTIEPQARAIALYLRLPRRNSAAPLSRRLALKLLSSAAAPDHIRRFLAGTTAYARPTPYSIGTPLTAELSSATMQNSLDVKHVQAPTAAAKSAESLTKSAAASSSSKQRGTEYLSVTQPVQPDIKADLLYAHPTVAWIRFYCRQRSGADLVAMLAPHPVLTLVEHVYEVYAPKQATLLYALINALEAHCGAIVVFCSEKEIFCHDTLVYYSNVIKFRWCYQSGSTIFDPVTYEHLRLLAHVQTLALLFLHTNNLSNMPSETHGPLVACSGERPKIALGKFEPGRLYTNEGSRAMQALGEPSDVGAHSHFVDVVSQLRLDPACLEQLVEPATAEAPGNGGYN